MVGCPLAASAVPIWLFGCILTVKGGLAGLRSLSSVPLFGLWLCLMYYRHDESLREDDVSGVWMVAHRFAGGPVGARLCSISKVRLGGPQFRNNAAHALGGGDVLRCPSAGEIPPSAWR